MGNNARWVARLNRADKSVDEGQGKGIKSKNREEGGGEASFGCGCTGYILYP